MDQLTDDLEIWRGLLRAQRSMLNRLMSEMKRDFDLTTAQYEALLSLHEVGGELSAGDLGRVLLYSSGSTTHLVARLEERGLVERFSERNDARRVCVRLTNAGRELIIDATDAHTAALNEQFAPILSDQVRGAVLEFARRFADAEGVTSQPPVR